MKKSYAITISFSCVLFFSSCATFLNKNDISDIQSYEKKEYILKDDAGEGDRFVKKGTKVKLYVQTSDEFIKVYCYPSSVPFLKSQRALIVYTFQEDFEKSKFNMKIFEEKLFSKVEPSKK